MAWKGKGRGSLGLRGDFFRDLGGERESTQMEQTTAVGRSRALPTGRTSLLTLSWHRPWLTTWDSREFPAPLKEMCFGLRFKYFKSICLRGIYDMSEATLL